jgi:hypothetical protein
MTVKELIEKLQNAVKHGQNPEAEVCSWDPDTDNWETVTVLSLSQDTVLLYTDEP